jgi:hypothetical protein
MRIGDFVVGDTISQIGIVVTNLQGAMETYWRTLRIGPWKVYTFAPPVLREPMIRGKPVEYSMRLALAQMPENVDEVLVAFQERGVDVLMSGKVGDGAFYYLDTESLLGLIFEVVKPRRTGLSPETTYPSPMT